MIKTIIVLKFFYFLLFMYCLNLVDNLIDGLFKIICMWIFLKGMGSPVKI